MTFLGSLPKHVPLVFLPLPFTSDEVIWPSDSYLLMACSLLFYHHYEKDMQGFACWYPEEEERHVEQSQAPVGHTHVVTMAEPPS